MSNTTTCQDNLLSAASFIFPAYKEEQRMSDNQDVSFNGIFSQHSGVLMRMMAGLNFAGSGTNEGAKAAE